MAVKAAIKGYDEFVEEYEREMEENMEFDQEDEIDEEEVKGEEPQAPEIETSCRMKNVKLCLISFNYI